MDAALARHNMVENQIRPNRVTDPVIIQAMMDLPRESFVPDTLKGVAYVDEALALGGGRYLMEPMVVARILQAAEVAPDDVVLTIGCGTGYAAAILSRMASTVVALESDPDLAAKANEILTGLNIDNVAVIEGPLAEGYEKQAPFNVIIIEGGIDAVPDRIAGQLAEGGRLVAPLCGAEAGAGHAILATRVDGQLSQRQVFDAGTPRLPGFEAAPGFVL